MADRKSPKLRTVEKVKPPYRLGKFPESFPVSLAKEVVYLLATKGRPSLEGEEWEEIFASCIGAEWKPSNVGLDDVVLGQCAWGAKTVKNKRPSRASTVRLISGRNSLDYSFGETDVRAMNPEDVGAGVIEIWNERVSSIRNKYKHLRTVVLMKSDDLLELGVFEAETVRYDYALYEWSWNKRGNLEGRNKSNGEHKFTWQPHGSQFTIKETVPPETMIVSIREPKLVDRDAVLEDVGFDESWVKVSMKNG